MSSIHIAIRIYKVLPYTQSHLRIHSEVKSITSHILEAGEGGPDWRRDSSKLMPLGNTKPVQVIWLYSATAKLKQTQNSSSEDRCRSVWEFPSVREVWRNLLSYIITGLSVAATRLEPRLWTGQVLHSLTSEFYTPLLLLCAF
jgi:hypothetical protein